MAEPDQGDGAGGRVSLSGGTEAQANATATATEANNFTYLVMTILRTADHPLLTDDRTK